MPILSPAAPGVVAGDTTHFVMKPTCGVAQQQGNGATQDVGSGIDFTDRLLSFDIKASINESMVTATIKLAMGRDEVSLSPLRGNTGRNRLGSRPAIMPHNGIGIGVGVGYPNGPSLNEFGIFSGRIDRISMAKGVVTLTCRDWGAYIAEATLRETAMFGNGSSLAEDVMEDILEAAGWSPFQLDVADPSDFVLYPYPVGEIGALDAIRTIAQQIGRDVRWFPNGWRGRPGGAIVHFYDPQRSGILPDAVFYRNEFFDIEEVAWGDEDVRNDWVVYYQDPATGLPKGPLAAEDATSIGYYGRRKARIYLQRAENIRTDEQAQNFANLALADTKDPFVSHKIRRALYPNVTLNDVHLYSGVQIHEYDEDLTLAVVGYEHHWDSKPGSVATTTISARGKPIAAYYDYRRSVPPKTIVANTVPTTEYAPEGTVIYVVAP